MKPRATILLLCSLGACSTPDTSSLGDSPVHDISCPNFMEWKMCLSRGERICNGAGYRLISPSAEELEKNEVQGRTVPIEGKIRYRTITIMCEE